MLTSSIATLCFATVTGIVVMLLSHQQPQNLPLHPAIPYCKKHTKTLYPHTQVLSEREFLEGGKFSVSDVAVGAYL